eukprot:563758-Pyramimonas_sp.AAC.1
MPRKGGRTLLDMWNDPEEPHGLDPKASNSIFGKGLGNEVGRIHQTIRTPFLDLVTGELLARNKGEGVQAEKT